MTLTVQGYAAAFATADGVAGCAVLTPESRALFVSRVRADVGDVSCPEAFGAVARGTPQDVRDAFGRAQVVDVAVDGARAEATLVVAGRANRIPLERRDQRWLIASAPGR